MTSLNDFQTLQFAIETAVCLHEPFVAHHSRGGSEIQDDRRVAVYLFAVTASQSFLTIETS